MSPSLPVFAPPLHIQICSRNAEKNGTWDDFDVFILNSNIFSDIAAHQKTKSTHCMFDVPDYSDTGSDEAISVPEQNSIFLIVPLVLTSLSHMLIYTAVFEFICSQSPHSMKGLLISLLYAIKGLYQLLATLLVVPFAVGYTNHPSRVGQMSCGFYYYLVNIVIGLIAVLTYMWVAKKYKYRERDEICEVHRYAEEYYSNPQQEQYYDYD